MKKILHLGIALAFLLALVPVGAMAHTEGDPYVTDLLAGQDMDVGDVLVWNDGVNLYVKYVVDDPWCLTETHLAVGTELSDIPQTKKGNPIPGQFDYSEYYEIDPCVTEYTYTIPLEWGFEEDLYIAAHAAVFSLVDGCYETVWEIGEVEEATCDGGLLTNYADEFNWVEYIGEAWVPLSDPCAVGPSLAVYEPPFTSPFYIGLTPNSEFPYNANTARGYGTDIDIVWDGELLFGGMLTVSWSPGQSATEMKVVTDGDGLSETFTANGSAQSGMGWFLDTYPLVENSTTVDPLSDGTHTINFTHTQGDGTFWDWIRLEKPCVQEETAWGDGEDFPGKNWATYFTYTVQEPEPVLVDTVIVPSSGATVNSIPLESGKSYLLKASGTYTYWQAQLPDAGIADAKYSLRPPGSYNPSPGPQWISGDDLPGSVQYYLQVWVNGSHANWVGDFNLDHIYTTDVVGTGAALSFRVIDDNYGDNAESLTVDIYELP